VFVRVAVLMTSLVAAFAAHAQVYPTRSVEVLAGFQAGGIIDGSARALARAMSDIAGQPFVVMNREGASGMIAATAVGNAKPDGYTIGFGPVTAIANLAYASPNPRFNGDDYEYVCRIFENVLTIMVPERSPYRSLQDLIADARARPGKLDYGHFGVNGNGHMTLASIADSLGLKVSDIPYKGEAPMYPELMSGRLDFAVGTVSGSRDKPVRVLAVVSDQRAPSYPDVPTVKEIGLPTMLPPQVGVYLSKKAPAEVSGRLAELCDKAAHSPSFTEFMARVKEPLRFQGPAEFDKTAHDAIALQIAAAKRMGIKP
jgi:tripartite-type tricarboxylate transporter receptor subunit TctC